MNKKWKALVLANVVVSLLLAMLCVQLYFTKDELRTDLYLELAKQDILIKNQEDMISDLKVKIDDLIWRMNRNEAVGSTAVQNRLERPESQINVHYYESEQKPKQNSTRERSYHFTSDSGDCTGYGDGIVGLFTDVFTKCPGNIFGYSIKVE
ncbi:MAG: hypothetical protein VYA55_07755 [Pseudomonadota bacterium]|nr:hypothetical protein [Pseudomonadota bacterium]